jgi:OHCU decarboxylase
MDQADFISRFGGVFEHSAWIAERAYGANEMPGHLSAEWLHHVLSGAFRAASEDERMKVLRAHPDLAGKLATAGDLTIDSRQEQAGAGLDRLTEAEFDRFTDLNTRYHAKFSFPFIIAVKGLKKDEILHAFENRIHNSRQVEFETACREVEKIASLRLNAMNLGQ